MIELKKIFKKDDRNENIVTSKFVHLKNFWRFCIFRLSFTPIPGEIFEMYSSGSYSIDDIVIYLNDNEYTPIKGNMFYPSSVHRILTNPIYRGHSSKGSLWVIKY